MKTTYYIVNKSDMSSCKSTCSARSVAAFLLGRRIDNFILIKDDGNPRVITPRVAEVTAIELQLEND